MGVTAENLAANYHISREAQDVFAFRSQQLALEAQQRGRFDDEIVPYTISSRKGDTIVTVDEHPRATTLEKLSQLPAIWAFRDAWDDQTIIDSKSRYTYEQLGQAVDRIALGLKQYGIQKGDIVSIQLSNWNEFVILHYAITKIGAVTNLLIPIYRECEIGYMVPAIHSKALIIPDSFRGFSYAEMIACERIGISLNMFLLLMNKFLVICDHSMIY